ELLNPVPVGGLTGVDDLKVCAVTRLLGVLVRLATGEQRMRHRRRGQLRPKVPEIAETDAEARRGGQVARLVHLKDDVAADLPGSEAEAAAVDRDAPARLQQPLEPRVNEGGRPDPGDGTEDLAGDAPFRPRARAAVLVDQLPDHG